MAKSDAPTSFAGFPKDKYHPVYGRRTVNDPNELAALQPERDWKDTPGEADMVRTDREAGETVLANMLAKHEAKGEAEIGTVRNSVQAQESLDATGAEPL